MIANEDDFQLTKTLKIANCPSNTLVSTNLAFVSQKEYPSFPQYIKINNSIVVIAQPHPSIEYGSIGLNRIQRQSSNLSINSETKCEIFQLPTNTEINIKSITFKVDIIGLRSTTVDGQRLISLIKNNFINHIFIDKQYIACVYDGFPLLLKVKDFKINEEDSSNIQTVGILHKNTIIRVCKSKSSNLGLINPPL